MAKTHNIHMASTVKNGRGACETCKAFAGYTDAKNNEFYFCRAFRRQLVAAVLECTEYERTEIHDYSSGFVIHKDQSNGRITWYYDHEEYIVRGNKVVRKYGNHNEVASGG